MNDRPNLLPRIPQRPLIWPDVVYELQAALESDSAPIYIVGGAVRDALLHRPLHDVDLIVPQSAVRLAKRIANHFQGAFFVLDAERDVGRALLTTPDGELTIDVAQFRGAGLLDDLSDRDFTINAMAVDVHGDLSAIIDPMGGEGDLQKKLVRRCHPDAIAHDPIRALRALRMGLQFSLHIESGTQQAVREAAPLLCQSSPERIRDELFKLLALPKPSGALRVADSLGLLNCTLPLIAPLRQIPPDGEQSAWVIALTALDSLSRILAAVSYHRTDNTAASFGAGMLVIQLDRFRGALVTHLDTRWANERPHQPLLVLALLLSALPDDPAVDWSVEVATLLRLSKVEQRRLKLMMRYRSVFVLENPGPREIHRFWREFGAAGVDVCLLALADYLGRAGVALDHHAWLLLVDRVRILLLAYFEQYDVLVEPPPLVAGDDLMRALGLAPGAVIGKLLDAIREAQAAGEVTSAAEAIHLAQKYLA